MSRPLLGGVVLAGGSSRRFGRPKASEPVPVGRLVDVGIRALRTAGASPLVVVGSPPGAGPLTVADDVVLLADAHPGEGPLPALVQGLRRCERPVTVVLACDLPWVTAAAVRAVAAAATGPADVAVPVVDGRAQWLAAAWRPTATDVLAEAVAAGERAVHRAAVALACVEVEPPDPGALRDVDRPDDLRRYDRAVPGRPRSAQEDR